MITMRELPGAVNLEDNLRLNTPNRGPLPPELELAVDAFSRSMFGITKNDVSYKWPEDYDFDVIEHHLNYLTFHRRKEIERQHSDYEKRFKTSNVGVVEAARVLFGLGISFLDENGTPLLSTGLLCRQAEAAARGFNGHLPDRPAIEMDRWSKNLEKDAELFVSKKRRTTSR